MQSYGRIPKNTSLMPKAEADICVCILVELHPQQEYTVDCRGGYSVQEGVTHIKIKYFILYNILQK